MITEDFMANQSPQKKPQNAAPVLWDASAHAPELSQLAKFAEFVESRHGVKFARPFDERCYGDIHRWSVENVADFWDAVWDFTGVIGDQGAATLEKTDAPPYVRFYPNARISYAENVLQYWIDHPDEEAVIYRHQDSPSVIWKGRDLCEAVSRWEQALVASGVQSGECIALNMPYTPDYLAIRLAAANLGAPVVKAGTEMKIHALLKRFVQASPVLLIAADGYGFKDKSVDYCASVREIQEGLPSLRKTLVLPQGERARLEGLKDAACGKALVDSFKPEELVFPRRDFDYPLAYLFSSGSTGTPKGFIHGQGNLILKHKAEHHLNLNIGPGSRYFQNSSITWMMSDYLDSAPATGATIMIYDGRHDFPTADVQLRFAADHKATHLGTSAGLIKATWMAAHIDARKNGIDLSALQYIIYTGGALHDKGFEYLHNHVSGTAAIWGVSGGTDLCGCFVGGNPFTSTVAGRIPGPMLGMDVQAWDDDGHKTAENEKGEMVCVSPFPSMPVGFLSDPGAKRYYKEYFRMYDGKSQHSGNGPVWAHGDKMAFVQGLNLVIYGRSGMTHNKQDLRSEPYDIYQELDAQNFPPGAAIREKASVNFFHPDNGDNLIVLFLAMHDGAQEVPADLQDQIRTTIAKKIGGYAVPDHIIAVPGLPKTPNGKDVEIPLSKIINGEEIDDPELYTGLDHKGQELPGIPLIAKFKTIGESLRAQYSKPGSSLEP
jgi:acetoacetyl-CoA synthetase